MSGLETWTEVIEYRDGDDLLVRKRPGVTKYGDITLKRGYVDKNELWKWREAVLKGKIERNSGSIILGADDGSEIVRYNFYEGWPCKWRSPQFVSKARGSRLLRVAKRSAATGWSMLQALIAENWLSFWV